MSAVARVAARLALAGYIVAVGLLVLAIFVPLPGWLARWNDTTAWEPVAIPLALGLLAFGAWAWPSRHRSLSFALVFLAAGTVSAVVVAVASYASCPPIGESRWFSVAQRVLAFVLNSYDTSVFDGVSCPDNPPLALQFGRLVVLTVLFVAATRAVAVLLRGQLDRALVRLAPRVTLAVGVDDSSAGLLPALAVGAAGTVRVVLTPDVGAAWVRSARAAGWRVVTGDPGNTATVRGLIRRGPSGSALRSLAVLSPDSTAAQRLVRAIEGAVSGRRAGGPVRVLVRIDDAWQAEDWRRRYLVRAADWVVDTISADEVTARLVVDDVLGAAADRVILAGRSGLTFAILGELAQQGREHEVLGEPPIPPVVVIDPDAAAILEQHEFSQVRYGNTGGVRATASAAPPTAAGIEEAAEGASIPAVVFTGEPSADAQRLAAVIGAGQPDWPVYSRFAEVEGLGAEPLLARVRAFGTTLDAGNGRPVDNWERIARLGHERYRRAHPDPAIASRRPWEQLGGFYRASNVRQVLATLGSAIAVGRSWGAGAERAGMPSGTQLERMAQLEHESWRRHLESHGWRHGSTRDDRRRRHPDLRDWERLDEAARDKNRDGVRSSLELLATLGYRSFDDVQWRTFARRGEVTARKRDEPWSWTTASGETLHGSAGDWEVVDERGSTHSVAAGIFEATHRPTGRPGRYERTGSVQGRPARAGEVIETLEGTTTAR
ncbi:MAG: RyR domain-containing protein, partial [Pseudolysinimonas sp.]